MPTVIYPYLYKSSGWRDQLVSYNGETFEYDELGNPTTCRGETFVWNGRQLVQLGDCKYTYNANGIRTSKIVNGIKTKFFLNGNKILAQNDGNKIYYHYGVDGIAGFTLKLSDTIIYDYIYKKNIQGDIIGIYDSNNVLICKYIYDAWGNHKTLILSNNGEYVDISSTSDYTNINNNYIFIANLNPFRYRSYYFDTDTGLYYLNTRYYDPELGRFINADAIDILNTAQEELNGLNLYAYCFNNPVNDIDENGNWSWKRFWKTLVTVVVAVAVVATIAAITVASGGSAAVVLAGAGIGTVSSGISSTITQLSSGNRFSFSQLFIDMSFGAITGAFGGSSFNVLGVAAGNSITSFFSSITSDWVEGNPIDLGKAGMSVLAGFITGLISGAGAQYGMTKHTKQLINSRRLIKNNSNYSIRGTNGAINLINYHIYNSRQIVKQLGLFNLKISVFDNINMIGLDVLISKILSI